ncbi:MAG TPA: EamA family transporter [Armatimonadota bacterium]
MQNPARHTALYTLLGGVAIVLWSSNIAFTREVTERFGTLPAAALAQLIGGGAGLLYLGGTRTLGALFRQPWRYLVAGSGLITLYMACLYLALGLSSRRQVVDISLINYLWPGLTLLLSVPLLKRRASLWLLVGILLAFAGVAIATLPPGAPMWGEFAQNLRSHALPYLLALSAALAWAVYSNISRRWASAAPVSAMPLFIFIAGVAMLPFSLPLPSATAWTPAATGSLLYLALGPTLLGYLLWDLGARHGRLTLLASLANFIPLFSTLIISAYLHVPLSPYIGLAVALLIGGAAICNAAMPGEGK